MRRVTCTHCGARRSTTSAYVSPANAKRDRETWKIEHETGACVQSAIETWGRDHYVLLLYIETRCVDHRGVLDSRHLRLDGKAYPTKLANGETRPGSNDLHVLADFEREGLVECAGLAVDLTDRGWEVAHAVRRSRAASGAIPLDRISAMRFALGVAVG